MTDQEKIPTLTNRRAAKPRGNALKKLGIVAVAVVAVVAAARFGYHYMTVGRYLETTNDAYVKADFTVVAPKISGYVEDVLVEDNQTVKAGQVLARIDDRDFGTALAQVKADVETAKAAIADLDAQLALQQSIIEQEKANVSAAEASLTFAKQDHNRYGDLVKTGYGTVQKFQNAEAMLQEATAKLQQSRAGLAAAEKKLTVLASQRTQAEAQVDSARAREQQAELNLSYTVIKAPVDGTVGARSLRVGQYVQAGTQLMAVVPLHAVYIVGNYKETQLTHVRAGQPATVTVDGFPGVTLNGHVDSLSPASGLEFSLLPPDNATGNFTKIVQRVPVKIVLDDDRLAGLLRPGMSVESTIDTKAAATEER